VKTGHARADLVDDACHVKTEHRGQWFLRMWRLASTDFSIEWVDAACAYS
jgi:transposase